MDFGGLGLGNQAIFMVKTNAFGQPPYALPGAEALRKICKKPRKNCGFHYDLLYFALFLSAKKVQRFSTCCIIW